MALLDGQHHKTGQLGQWCTFENACWLYDRTCGRIGRMIAHPLVDALEHFLIWFNECWPGRESVWLKLYLAGTYAGCAFAIFYIVLLFGFQMQMAWGH